MEITTISDLEFKKLQTEAIEKQPIRKRVSMGSLQLENRDTLIVDGVSVSLSGSGFKDLLGHLKIPKKFLERFESKFGAEGSSQFLNTIRKSMVGDEEVVLFINRNNRTIDAIRHPNHTGITNEGFLGLISDTVNQYDLKVSNFFVGPDGSFGINAIAPGYSQIPGMKKEIFSSGVSFNNSARGGTDVNPYALRLVCLNGLMSRSFSENYSLKNLEPASIERFNQHLLELGSNGFQPVGFADRIIKSDQVPASLNEMQCAASAIMSNSKIEWNELQKYVPLQETTDYFSRHGIDTNKFTSLQSKNATTGVNLWTLINGMTNFASNGSGMYFDDEIQRNRILMSAGQMFSRTTYDTENIVISPYSNSRKKVETVETGDTW